MRPSQANLRAAWEGALSRADRALASGPRWPLVILACAFALKLVFVVQSADALYVRVPIMDSRYYDHMAQEIAHGRLARNEAFFMGPLYPYFLALVYALGGRDFMLVRALQALGGAATVMFAFLVGRRVFRPSAALLGAGLLAFYGAMTFYETELLMEWMGALLDVAALWLLVSGSPQSKWKRFAGAGVLLGLSALARANILVFAVFAAVWILREPHPARRARALAFAGALVATLLPAMVHNAIVSGVFVPVTSNAGLNFFVGNSRTANGSFVPASEVDVFDDLTTREYLARKTGRELNPSEISSYWFSRAFHDMRLDPARALRLMATKVALFFNGYEMPQIESFDVQRRQFGWLRVLFIRLWFIVPLAVLGMVLRAPAARPRGLLNGFVLLYAASIVVFFVTGRYRAQAAPVLCLFAGHALLTLPSLAGSFRSTVAWAAGVAALVLATSPAIFKPEAAVIEFREQIHHARRLSEIGGYQPALREIDRAIALYPDEPEGYIHRAIIHREAHNDFKAIEDYRRALKLDDRQPDVHYDLAQALRRVNLREQAVTEYRRAAELDPTMAQAYNNLGVTMREMGRYDDAIAAFRKSIAVEPRYRRAYNNLGASYAEAGKMGDAIATFEETIRRFPDYPNGYKNLAMAYASLKQPRRALDAMRRYAALNPSDAQAAEAIRKLEIAARADSASAPN